MDDDETLPPDIAAQILREQAEGITYTLNLRRGPRADDVTGIRWRPGDPNPLAAAIIETVTKRTELDLDGHRYWIEPR